MLIMNILEDALNTIQTGIFWLLLQIDAIIYNFANWLYQIILMLANGNLLENDDLVGELLNRIYVIVGVIVLFLVAYSLLRSMVNPDEALKGKESPTKILLNVISSVVLIAIVPYIFTFAMDFQSSLLRQNTIGRLILGEGTGNNSTSDMINDGGFNLAINVFSAFFQPNTNKGYCTGKDSIDIYYPDCRPLEVSMPSYELYDEWWEEEVINDRNFSAIADVSDLVAANDISYTFIISTIAGIFVVFVLVSYCIEIAIRLVKLAVFQIMAPLPILARIVPKEDTKKIFSNWLKATISAYVEVFIRLGVLFFVVFIVDVVVDNFNTIFDTMNNLSSVNPVLVLIAQALVILGIVLFALQLPNIIKDITGLDSGKYNVFGSALMSGALLGAGVTAAVRNWNTKNPDGSSRSFGAKLRSAAGGFGSAALRSTMHRGDIKGLKDVKQNIRNSTEEAIKKRIERENAKQEQKAYIQEFNEQRARDGKKDLGKFGIVAGALKYKAQRTGAAVTDWASGSFEVQQQILNEVNEFMKNAKAVKSTTEGLVRDKKYLFKMGNAKDYGNGIQTNGNETLSEIESMITTLKNSGDVEQAKIAARLESDMNKRIKTIGVQMQSLSTKDFSNANVRATFNNDYMAEGFDIYKEASATLATAKSQIDIVSQKMQKNSSLEAVVNFKNLKDDNGNPLVFEENISKLADELEIQSANLTQQISSEQVRRKNASKGGKDK